MKISGNAILITGGMTGLGFELAETLSDLGNDFNF
jgi:short-subunit dehydrogenase involved in D-alanine esterification of teichoic acids